MQLRRENHHSNLVRQLFRSIIFWHKFRRHIYFFFFDELSNLIVCHSEVYFQSLALTLLVGHSFGGFVEVLNILPDLPLCRLVHGIRNGEKRRTVQKF